MATLDLIVIENGRRKRKPSIDQTIDFASVRIGASNLPISETDGKFDFGNKVLSNIASGVNPGDVVTKTQMETYVGSAAIQGGVVKQQLLTQRQLDGTLGILPGTVFYLTANPTANDTITFTDASANTETFTFVETAASAFEVTIGADAAESMENLASAIGNALAAGDSVYWHAYYDPNALDALYADGLIGIYRQAIDDFYLYVTATGGTIAGVVADFSTEEQYKTDPTAGLIPTSDPGASTVYSGFKIAKASLDNGELHNVLAEDKIYSWNGDFNAGVGEWFIMAEGAVNTATAASGGGVLGKITADSDNGLTVAAGVLSVNISSTFFEFSTGAVSIKNGAIDANQLAGTSVTAAKLGSDVAGNGLTGGNGSALAVSPDATGGDNLAKVISVTANGVAVAVDDTTIVENGSGQLGIKGGGVDTTQLAGTSVTAAKLGIDVAGNGLTGGNGSAVAVGAGTAIKVGTSDVSVDFAVAKTNDNAGAITVGQIVYVKANGSVDLAQATVASLDTFELGIVEDASIAASESGKIILRRGAIVAGFTGLTPGAHLYVSRETAGAYQQTLAGFVAGEFVYSVGRAISATEVCFNPEFMFEY